jgi:hypothetical protein
MTSIQIITLRGRTAAIAVNSTAVIAPDVRASDLAHVQAKALYALEIQYGTLPGPYTDADAEEYADRATAAPLPCAEAPRTWPRDCDRRSTRRR